LTCFNTTGSSTFGLKGCN